MPLEPSANVKTATQRLVDLIHVFAVTARQGNWNNIAGVEHIIRMNRSAADGEITAAHWLALLKPETAVCSLSPEAEAILVEVLVHVLRSYPPGCRFAPLELIKARLMAEQQRLLLLAA